MSFMGSVPGLFPIAWMDHRSISRVFRDLTYLGAVTSAWYIMMFLVALEPAVIIPVIATIIIAAIISTSMVPTLIDTYSELTMSSRIVLGLSRISQNIHLLFTATCFYLLVSLPSGFRVHLVAVAAACDVAYLYPFIKDKLLEYRALKRGFPLWRYGRSVLVKKGDGNSPMTYSLVSGDNQFPLTKSEARFLYWASKTDKSEAMVREFIGFKEGFEKGAWTIYPTPESHIYLMVEKDAERLIQISYIEARALWSGTQRPEDIRKRIDDLTPDIRLYRELTSNLRNVRFAGTFAVVYNCRGVFAVDLQCGRVYHENRFICLVTKSPASSTMIWDASGIVQLDGTKVEILSKIYHLASEEPKVMELTK